MTFLIFFIASQIWTLNINAQKFRMDYLWANAFKTFYRVHDLSTTWDEARQICEAEGTSLLIPDSIEEMDNLKLLMSNMKAHYTGVFIGLHDKFSSGDYVNLKGESIAGTKLELLWRQGCPDNVNGTEHCVIMTREGLFDDRPCNDIYPFICKILGNETKLNEKCNSYDLGYIQENNGKCYKFHEEPLTWHDAYLICKSEEGSLVIINSQEEANLIASFLSIHLKSKAPDANILYIGFSDLMFQYQYRTLKDRICRNYDVPTGQSLQEAGYSSWSPATEKFSEMESKRCGAISRTGFLMMSWCDRPAMFLCEKVIENN